MKNYYWIVLTIGLFSCESKSNELLGIWELESPFYKAVYRIIDNGDSVKTQILFYDDDTYRYRFNGQNLKYQFQNIKEKEGYFVDAVSGATENADEIEESKLEFLNADTLLVTTYKMKKTITEKWGRRIENQINNYE
jgi:hypothetical protein